MRGLESIRRAGAGLDIALPSELVQQCVDAGRSPDDFSAEMHARVARSSAAVQLKRHALRHLEAQIREHAGDLVHDEGTASR